MSGPPLIRPPVTRPVPRSEADAFLAALGHAFGAPPDPAEMEIDREVVEWDRALAAVDEDRNILGTAAAFSFDLTVPGAVLPAAGVTAVGVAPTHRRRGILTDLMHAQFADVAARGEPLAVLYASEPAIYGRFGYGAAATALRLRVPRAAARVTGPPDTGQLRVAEPERVQPELAAVFDAVRRDRPGHYARTASGWRLRLFDPESRREGYAALRAVLHLDAAGVADGYALYATKPHWHDALPDGAVSVREVQAANPTAAAALWRYLLSLDLMGQVSADVAPDDPLLTLLADVRLARPRLADNLWVRIVDVGAALAGRAYPARVDVVLSIEDPLLEANAGCWRLEAQGGSGRCQRTDDPADLRLGIAALGAAYLGGPSLAALAAAGLVEELRPGALAATATAFGWPRRPFCPQLF